MSELYFPLDSKKTSWTSKKTQGWSVTKETSASGRLRTITNQQLPKRGFEITFKTLTKREADILDGFYATVKGPHTPFYYMDPEDNSVKDQLIPKIEPGVYQCIIPTAYTEAVHKVINLVVYIKGKVVPEDEYTVEDGLIKFNDREILEQVHADYTYFHKVVFVDSTLNITQIFQNIYKATIKMEVAR